MHVMCVVIWCDPVIAHVIHADLFVVRKQSDPRRV